MSDLPYVILKEEEDTQYRLFARYTKEDLYWHRDHEDRDIKCVLGSVSFQKDNELPVHLEAGDSVSCPAETLHRLIPDEHMEPFLLEIHFK